MTGPKRNKQIERIEQHTVRRTVRCMQRSIWTPRKPSHNDTVPAPNSTLQPIRYPAIGASSTVIWMDGKGWSATDGVLVPADGASTLLNGRDAFVDEPPDAPLLSCKLIVSRTVAVGGFLIGFGDCVVVRLQ